MSSDRGKRLQHAAARQLRQWWPHAESNPNGRVGLDILGTPGVAFEIKTAAEFRPASWVRQAKRNAATGDIPVVLYFPNGAGEQSFPDVMAILPVSQLMRVLVHGGYTPGYPPEGNT